MSLMNPPLTKDDFTSTYWQDGVNSCEQKDCLTYHSIFWEKAEEAQKSGDLRKRAVFEILTAVTSTAIKPESTEEFFAKHFENLTNEQIDFLIKIAPEISDPELQARVTDILWVMRSGYDLFMIQR